MTLGEFFKGLAENRPLVSSVTAWAVAQVLKTIINYLINKEWKAERLWGSASYAMLSEPNMKFTML